MAAEKRSMRAGRLSDGAKLAISFASSLAIGFVVGLVMPEDGDASRLPVYLGLVALLLVSLWLTKPGFAWKSVVETVLILFVAAFSAFLGAMGGALLRWLWLHPDTGPDRYGLWQSLSVIHWV
jgi:hypothetical protein